MPIKLICLLLLLLAQTLSVAAFAARPPKRKGGGGKGRKKGGKQRNKSPARPATNNLGGGAAAAPAAPAASLPDLGLSADVESLIRPPTTRELSFLNASPHNTGMALMSEGRFEEAGLAFEKALDVEPDALETWSALGVCMAKLGQPEAALVCQRRVEHIRATSSGETSAARQEREVSELAADTEALPPLPSGQRLRISTGSLADCDTGGRVWSAAIVLCRWLAAEDRAAASSPTATGVYGTCALELGCGTGAVGLYSAGLGAKHVLMTDGGPPAILDLAKANVDTNRELWEANSEDGDSDDDGAGGERRTRVELKPLMWGPPTLGGLTEAAAAATDAAANDAATDAAAAATGADTELPPSAVPLLAQREGVDPSQLEWLLGSDLAYSMGAQEPLCWTIREVLEWAKTNGAAAARAANDGGGDDGESDAGSVGQRQMPRWRPCRAILSHEHRVTSASVPDERLINFEKEAAAAGLRLTTLSTEVEGGRRISVLELELAPGGD